MPVKVVQIKEYLFSDTLQSQKTDNSSGDISRGQYTGISVQVYSLNQVQTKVEKRNERDEFLVFFCETELERWQGVM